MRWLLNTVYLLLLTVISPFIAWRILRHGRYRQGIAEKLLGRLPTASDSRDVVWFHAVSVGEIIQLQKIVDEFRRQTAGEFRILVSTSTDTGFELALKRFPDCQVTWFPLDFSWAVANALRCVRPRLVVLMELELWPNFLAECQRQDVAAAVINARMSERSHRGYSRIRRLMAPLFGKLALVAVQSQSSANRLLSLGVIADRLHVTGSIKFDGVATDRKNPATERLGKLFGLSPSETVFIAGSTQDPEEKLALEAWLACRTELPSLRLILVPRHRERFEEVARMIRSAGVKLARRSLLEASAPSALDAVILLDSIGELSACWGLADIAFVGGSFGNRGGQNMIEPAAFGAAVMFGPNTWNFRDVVQTFKDARACVQLDSPDELAATVVRLATHPVERIRRGQSAQQAVIAQAGATAATVMLLAGILRQHSVAKISERAA
ncbi:MAG: 3-deoxy-D-manno-octulosonic acid transferase [Planctomycetota bacterium]|nr:3-deoxy-D-manno-octulosonic acid transferase [Planctomycetota bacterium]